MKKKSKDNLDQHNPDLTKKVILVLLSFFVLILFLSTLSPIPVLENDIENFKAYPFSFVDLLSQKYPPSDNLMGYVGVFFAYYSFKLIGFVYVQFLYLLILLFLINYILFKSKRFSHLLYYLCAFSFFLFSNSFIFSQNDLNYSFVFHYYSQLLLSFFNRSGAFLINFLFLFLTTGFYFGFSKIKLFLLFLIHHFFSLFKRNSKPVEEKKNKKKDLYQEPIPAPEDKIEKKHEDKTSDFDAVSDIGINFLSDKNENRVDDDSYLSNIENVSKTIFETHDSNLDPDAVYVKPQVESFLFKSIQTEKKIDKAALQEEINQTCQILLNKLQEFDIEAKVMNVNIGPIITQYELQPAPGIKVNRFVSLSDDLSLALKAKSIRVQAPIPGRGLIGIEIPNKLSDVIYLRDVLMSEEGKNNPSILNIGLGKDIAGRPIVTDLSKMPHLLIAGATGAGKSVCINTIIASLLFNTTPDEVRLVMIDPKRIELSGYEGIPHLIQNVVTDPDDAMNALNWAVYEMERRYELLQDVKVRDINGYNQKIDEQFGPEEAVIHKLPYIVVIVDEFADLIMTAGREIEMPITRLAQMARAIGIHLILATQRPSIKVITGVIKANFPARIAFRVSSKVDSRVILDSMGAEKLLGRGDMLFLPPGKANPERIHGAFLSDSEIESLVEYLKTQPKPFNMIQMTKPDLGAITEFDYDDELFPESARLIVASNTASVSMLQRHFKIGYARAGRLIDLLERAGVIGPHVGSKSRDVLMSMEDLDASNFKKSN